MIDDTREEYFRGADTDAARGGGASADRGGRDAGMPGPSGEAADRAADSRPEGPTSPGRAEAGASQRKAHDDATAPVTDPGPTS
jgi:hypothetical protein